MMEEQTIEERNQSTEPVMRGPGAGMAGGEKAQNFRQSISQLLQFSRGYLPVIGISIFLAIAGSILNIIGPDYLSRITDLITDGLMTGIDITAVTSIALLLAVFYSIGFLCNVIQGVLMNDVSQKISKGLRTEISEKINRLPLRYFDKTSHGDILSRVTNDVDTVGQSLTQSLSSSVTSITMLIGSLAMMLYTNWIMTLAGVAATILGFAFMLLIISKSQKYFTLQQNELGRINGHIEEMYTGHSVVKAYNGEKKAKDDFVGMNGILYSSAWKSQFLSGLMMPLMSFIGNFGYVVVCIAGAILVLNGSISFGVIVAFMVYIRLFTQPLTQIAQVATNLQTAAAASERVFDFLGEEELADESGKTLQLAGAKGNVDFQHVRFGYDEEKVIIKDFSAKVKQGQNIAIVGPTGAGKTTLVNLLMRFYEVNSGSIHIDGVAADQLTRENVHDLFAMVLQDTWLFEGTIKENIVYSMENVSDEQVVEASKAVGLHHFVMTLPQGYDTVINENANLSAGQRQLVTIARAMIKNAPMLILDEATSSVDTRTEVLIQQAMERLMAGRTSFIIAHRLSTIRNADLILVMDQGDIIEKGTHEELMAQNGFYSDLYNSQFED